MKFLPKRGTGCLARDSGAVRPWESNRFDETTGLMYTERTVAVQSGNDRDWTRQTGIVAGPDYLEDYEQYVKDWEKEVRAGGLAAYQEFCDDVQNAKLRGKGPRSLQGHAIECILRNISDVNFEVIECLPIPLVRRLWHAVNKRTLMCFNTWMIFSKILHKLDISTMKLLRYRQIIKTPISPLYVYTNPLTSNSFEFLTHLSITASFPMSDLVKLSKITNLGTLEIVNPTGMIGQEPLSQPFPAVGDRLVRAWHLAALEGAFSVLRILKLRNHKDLTSNSLVYLNSFPSLALYDVHGCGFDFDAEIKSRQYGWTMSLDPDVIGQLDAVCAERVLSMQTRPGLDVESIRKRASGQLSDGARIRRIPRSEVPDLLSQRDAPALGEASAQVEPFHRIQEKLAELESKQTYTNGPIPGVLWRMRDSALDATTKGKAWEFETYTAFARVGELRNDSDLSKAGVAICDQALVADELVSSVPIACLRLGQTPPYLRSDSTHSQSQKAFQSAMYEWMPKATTETFLLEANLPTLSFMRIKSPDSVTAATHGDYFVPLNRIKSLAIKHTEDLVMKPTEDLAIRHTKDGKKLKHLRRGVMRSIKRQKLANVLHSFL